MFKRFGTLALLVNPPPSRSLTDLEHRSQPKASLRQHHANLKLNNFMQKAQENNFMNTCTAPAACFVRFMAASAAAVTSRTRLCQCVCIQSRAVPLLVWHLVRRQQPVAGAPSSHQRRCLFVWPPSRSTASNHLLILAQQVADRLVEEGTAGGAAAWGSRSPDQDACHCAHTGWTGWLVVVSMQILGWLCACVAQNLQVRPMLLHFGNDLEASPRAR
jgi:hypothetical protein